MFLLVVQRIVSIKLLTVPVQHITQMVNIKGLFNIIIKSTYFIGLMNVSVTAKCHDGQVLELAFNPFTRLNTWFSAQHNINKYYLRLETAYNLTNLITIGNG